MNKILILIICLIVLTGCTNDKKKEVVIVDKCPELKLPIYTHKELLDIYYKRLTVCFDYNPDSGTYVWRHDYCIDAEKEYLELFGKFKNNIKE